MGFIESFLRNLWVLSVEASLYLLLGFAVATLLHAYLPTDSLLRLLGKGKIRPTVVAAMIGIPLPLCSCSVVPTAVAIRKKGASPGATLSFFISTPETGVDSIILTYGMMGPFGGILAIARPLAAGLSAILAGISLDNFGPANPILAEGESDPCGQESGQHEEDHSCCSLSPAPESTCCSDKNEELANAATIEKSSCCSSSGNPDSAGSGEIMKTREGPDERWKAHWSSIRNSFYLLFDEVAWLIALGLAFSAIIAALIPDDFGFSHLLGNQFVEMGIAVLIGLPMYVCATASTPLAAVLISKGLSPGAALVFLLVGPATNLGTIALVKKILGKTAILYYLTSIVVISVLFGLFINWACQDMLLDISSISDHHSGSTSGSLAAIFLWILLGWRTWIRYQKSRRQKT